MAYKFEKNVKNILNKNVASFTNLYNVRGCQLPSVGINSVHYLAALLIDHFLVDSHVICTSCNLFFCFLLLIRDFNIVAPIEK